MSCRLPHREAAGLSVASTRAPGRDQASVQRHVSTTARYSRPRVTLRHRHGLGRQTRRPTGGIEGDINLAVGKLSCELSRPTAPGSAQFDFVPFHFRGILLCYTADYSFSFSTAYCRRLKLGDVKRSLP